MDAYTADLENELNLVTSALEDFAPLLAQKTQDVDGEPPIKIAGPTDVPLLRPLAKIPQSPQPLEQAIEDAFTVLDYRIRGNHSRFLSVVPGPSHPYSWLGECIASAFNSLAGCRLNGSGAAFIEGALVKWLASKIGLPSDTAGGLFVSGGSMANLTALIAARDKFLKVGDEGRGVAYISDQTHHSVAKGLRVLRQSEVRIIPSDDKFRMKTTELSAAIEADRERGLIPFVIIGTSGTTVTGSVDPLYKLAEICRMEGMWLHIDGAYGASAILSSRRSVLDGLHLADSISWDAHKWLFQTYGCSVLLVKNKNDLVRSFAASGDYLPDPMGDDDIPPFWNYGVELTRPARAIKLWFTLRVLGEDVIRNMIDQGFLLAERAEAELRTLPDWEIMSPVSLAVVTFRFAPVGWTGGEDGLDELNRGVSRRLIEDNVAAILTTKLRGRMVLRICAINPALTLEGMSSIIRKIDALARDTLYESSIAQGHTNGHGDGHANGHTNGHSNGHANGHANGRANGDAAEHTDKLADKLHDEHLNGVTNGHVG